MYCLLFWHFRCYFNLLVNTAIYNNYCLLYVAKIFIL